MFDTATFQIIGRVGKVKAFDGVMKVSIAADSSYRKDGAWTKRTDWNEVTIFTEKTRDYVEEHVRKGDYVRIEGSLRQRTYERNGETVYTTELIVDQFNRMPTKRKADDAQTEE